MEGCKFAAFSESPLLYLPVFWKAVDLIWTSLLTATQFRRTKK